MFPRIILLSACTVLAWMPLRAQEQDKTGRMNQILKPSTTLEYNLEKSSFNGGRQFHSSSRAHGKEFHFQQKFAPTGFSTKPYGGTKTPWFGNFKFSTDAADTTGRQQIPGGLNRTAETKTMAVNDARESDKTMATREMPGANREYLGPEAKRVQKALVENQKAAEKMSIEQVRDLLNKTK